MDMEIAIEKKITSMGGGTNRGLAKGDYFNKPSSNPKDKMLWKWNTNG